MDDTKLSIIDHLEELRFRILWSLGAIVIMFTPGYLLALPAINALIRFTCPEGTVIRYIKPMELFFTQLEVALLFAVVFALPVIAFQTWRFVAPALYQNEKQMITRLSGASCLLFILGFAFAIGFVFPSIMRFSIGMETDEIKADLIIDSFINLAICLSLGFGAMFQLPIVICFLVGSGIVALDTMKKVRPVVVAVIFIMAALFTPPDVVSQLALGVPTWGLFEIALLISRSMAKKREKRLAEEAAQQALEDAEEAAREAQMAAEAPTDTPMDTPQPTYANADDPAAETPETSYDYYDYSYNYEQPSSSSSTGVRVRNLTPGKHFSRRSRTRTR